MITKTKKDFRKRRHFRVRHKVKGTAERPRMAVFLSNKHIYVQFIDDVASKTLASASTVAKSYKGKSGKSDIAAAKEVGKLAAEAAVKQGVKKAVFDRGGYAYEGRVQAIADAARETGLTI